MLLFKSQKRPRKTGKKAFTLIEILTVIAIIGIVATVIIGLQPGNPHGLDDACRLAATEFKIAQNKAVLSANPDRDPDTIKRYNVRSGVLVLNNPNDEERHLRYVVPIVGGTATESTDPSLSEYFWYAVSDSAGVTLPKGVYFVPPTETVKYKSEVTPLEGANEITLDPSTQSGGTRLGSGKQKWFVYYFDTNGQTYMSKATFMVAEGTWDAGAREVIFDNEKPVSGFSVTRNGSIIYMRGDDELDAAQN